MDFWCLIFSIVFCFVFANGANMEAPKKTLEPTTKNVKIEEKPLPKTVESNKENCDEKLEEKTKYFHNSDVSENPRKQLVEDYRLWKGPWPSDQCYLVLRCPKQHNNHIYSRQHYNQGWPHSLYF